MDSFGRLPTDVLDKITKLNDVLEVIIEDKGNQQIFMTLKTIHYTCKFQCMTPLVNVIGGGEMCCKSGLLEMGNLIKNKCGSYIQQYEEELFSISITQEEISISTPDVTMTLPICYLDDFIAGLQTLYNILDTYPKY